MDAVTDEPCEPDDEIPPGDAADEDDAYDASDDG